MYYIVLYYIILYCIILYYIILYYIMFYYVTLCHIIFYYIHIIFCIYVFCVYCIAIYYSMFYCIICQYNIWYYLHTHIYIYICMYACTHTMIACKRTHRHRLRSDVSTQNPRWRLPKVMLTTPVAVTAMAPAISARLHLDQLAAGPRKISPMVPESLGMAEICCYTEMILQMRSKLGVWSLSRSVNRIMNVPSPPSPWLVFRLGTWSLWQVAGWTFLTLLDFWGSEPSEPWSPEANSGPRRAVRGSTGHRISMGRVARNPTRLRRKVVVDFEVETIHVAV